MKGSKHPVSVQPCGKSVNQRMQIAFVSVEESAKAANARYKKEKVIGHGGN